MRSSTAENAASLIIFIIFFAGDQTHCPQCRIFLEKRIRENDDRGTQRGTQRGTRDLNVVKTENEQE